MQMYSNLTSVEFSIRNFSFINVWGHLSIWGDLVDKFGFVLGQVNASTHFDYQ